MTPKMRLVDPHAPSDDAEYWRSKTPEERVAAVEFLRRQCALTAGDGPMPRLVKVLRLVDRKKA
ncbi:MAG: hypothetical protein HKL90_10555 [Elusimicrobia bacterium]|nr:hypothetical protein [Elusimicrobiota bacterium]